MVVSVSIAEVPVGVVVVKAVVFVDLEELVVVDVVEMVLKYEDAICDMVDSAAT